MYFFILFYFYFLFNVWRSQKLAVIGVRSTAHIDVYNETNRAVAAFQAFISYAHIIAIVIVIVWFFWFSGKA